MSFLDALKKQKNKLRETETVVTNADGKKYIEKGNDREDLGHSTYGFVVDTKPDDIPVLLIEHLYIGSQDCTAANVIEKYNIKNVLSLGIHVAIDNVSHKFVDCLDLPETDIKPILSECLPLIHKSIECKENILIHCNAGVSRTSMIAIGYLMHYKCMGFDEAYSFVKEKRPAVQPNDGFRKQLKGLIPGKVL